MMRWRRFLRVAPAFLHPVAWLGGELIVLGFVGLGSGFYPC